MICTSSTYSKRCFGMGDIELRNVRSKQDLVINDNVIVLQPVEATLTRLFFKGEEFRQRLRLPGSFRFLNFLDFISGDQDVSTLPNTDHVSLLSDRSTPTNQKVKGANVLSRVDKYFVFMLGKRGKIPAYSIEYKVPFEFSAADIVQGLQGDIFPERKLINKDDKGSDFFKRRLVSAVITQLYSYMVKTPVKYGYVSTGAIMIFLHILDDPEQVEYHVWNLLDFNFDESTSLHNTAIAEVVTFTIQDLVAKPPPQYWHDAVAKLENWPIKNCNVLDILETKGKVKAKPDTPAYRPDRKLGLSVIHDDEDSNDGEWEESPTRPSDFTGRSSAGRAGKKRRGGEDKTARSNTENYRKRVPERDYCLLPCLLGLARGGHLDLDCPNIADHGKRHLKRLEFLNLVQEQLARDRGHVIDCEPLWIGGARGAMFKVTLTSHGYTVIAKGVQIHDVPYLKHEAELYRHLSPIQGIHIPVCLGDINLILPYYHMTGQFVRFLFQSYAGVSVYGTVNKKNKRT